MSNLKTINEELIELLIRQELPRKVMLYAFMYQY